MEVNPFVNTSINITNKELYSRFSRILVLCLKNNTKHNNEILNPTVNDISKLMQNYTILETSNLRLVHTISNKLMIINSCILQKFFDYDFKDEELVIMMYLVNEKAMTSYLKQHNGLSNLEDYITSINIDQYLNRKVSNEIERINRCNLLKIIDENIFWSSNICKLNTTKLFITRKNIKNIISKDLNNDNYLNDIEKSHLNDINESSKIKYTLYYITEHPITKKLSIENFNNIIDYLVDNNYKEEFYYLVMNLLSSKELCHYIINNQHVLEIINKPDLFYKPSFLQKYIEIIKYIFSYAWLTLYTEENIKKTNTTIKDRFIFTIEIASLLPYFPYDVFNPKTSPYLPITVADNVLFNTKNCFPVSPIYNQYNYKYGVCDINTFKKKLSIFFSNTEHDLLEGLDYNGIGITGSCIACCLPNFNPLNLMFDDFNSFVNEYYNNADLDVISNLSDFDFVDKANHIIDILKTNISNKLGKTDVIIKSNFIKSIFISYNDDYIKDNFNCSNDDIDLNNPEIKEHFYNKYIEQKTKIYNNNIDTYPLDKYQCIYDNLTIDNIFITYKQNIYFNCYENIKYKISSPYTKEIEFFQVKANDFFKVLSTFHLPIVRAYYNGSTVYMTSSCISACMTLYNLDIKYFSSSNHPAEIINKYRQRGFGVFLNKNEKIALLEYSYQTEKWYNKYNIQHKNTINNIFNIFDIKNDFYKNNTNYNYNYNIFNYNQLNWKDCFFEKYHSVKLNYLDLVGKNIIDHKGYVIPLNTNFIIIAYTLF